MNEWGSIVALSYMAAQRVFPDYNDMADNKAFLESIARSFGYHYGVRKNVRVNTISQSPTLTTAGSGVKGFDVFYKYSNNFVRISITYSFANLIIRNYLFSVLFNKFFKIYIIFIGKIVQMYLYSLNTKRKRIKFIK